MRVTPNPPTILIYHLVVQRSREARLGGVYMVSLTILTSHRNGETHTMEKFAVYFISKKSAKIFSNVHDEFIASFPTFERAKDFCDINNECGYMDDRHVGYEVRKVETNEGK